MNPDARERNLAAATDALVLAACTERFARDGYTLVRTPTKWNFWFGNCLVLDAEPPVAQYERWLHVHAHDFAGLPVERHVVSWEIDLREAPPDAGPLALDIRTVFTVRKPPRVRPLQAAIRSIDTDEDWAAVAGLVRMDAREAPGGPAFALWRLSLCRADARVGKCRVWGAFDESELLGFAGLYASADYARFITPVTRETARRRGLFRALSHVAVEATLQTFPAARIAIVAAYGSEAEQVYLRLGFEPAGRQYAIVAPV